MANVTLSIHADPDALSRAAAQRICDLASEAIAARGAFHIALSGGSTPRRLYQILAGEPFSTAIDWCKVHVYFGDERCVPPDHPDSNYGMAEAALLRHVPIPREQVHGIAVDMATVQQDAQRYAQLIAAHVPHDAQGMPSFDLVLLGMGPDGHTASLFPGSTILQVRDQAAAAVYVEKFKSWRVSITYPVINHARRLMFLVAGADKAAMLRHVFAESSAATVPVQGINAQGAVEWWLDSAAAAQLPEAVQR